MSRLLTVWLTLWLAVPGIAGAAERVVLWHSYRGAEETALIAAVEAFEAEGGADVEVLAVPYEVMASKLTNAIPRGNGPDVFVFAHERVGGWADTGLLRPVADWAGAPALDAFPGPALEALTYGERRWGLPLSVKSLALFRNTDVVPEAPATMDDLLAAARASVARGGSGIAYESESFYFHAPWYFGHGGALTMPPPLVDFEGPAWRDSLAFLADLVDEGLVPEEPTGALVAGLFRSGDAPFAISGPWFLAELEGGVPWAVSPLPRFADGRPASPLLTVEAVFVSATAERPDDGAALASFVAGPEGARLRGTLGRQVVAHGSAWDDPALADDPVLTAFRDQAALAVPMDNRPAMRDVWEPSQIALKKVMRGLATPEQAAEASYRRWKAITKPVPPEASPTPYLALLATGALALAALVWRFLAGLRARGEVEHTARSWAWAGPATVATVVLVFVPFAVGIGISTFAHRGGDWTFVGLANYVAILSGSTFPHTEPLGFAYALAVTVLWTAANVALHLGLGLFLAILLNDANLAGKPIYRVLLILPWAVPNYITALIWKGMFHKQQGAINGLLELVGVEPVSWFGSFPTAFFANLCTNVWLGFPFMMVVCLGALQAIPSDLYEAAEVDGASRWQQFRHVTLPLLRPALIPAVLLGTVWTFNQFNIVYLVSGGEPDGATEILISEAYRWAFTRQEQYGYAAAYAVLIFVVLLGWSWVSTRISRSVEAAT